MDLFIFLPPMTWSGAVIAECNKHHVSSHDLALVADCNMAMRSEMTKQALASRMPCVSQVAGDFLSACLLKRAACSNVLDFGPCRAPSMPPLLTWPFRYTSMPSPPALRLNTLGDSVSGDSRRQQRDAGRCASWCLLEPRRSAFGESDDSGSRSGSSSKAAN